MKMNKKTDNLPVFLRVHSVKIASSSKKDRGKKAADEAREISKLWPEYALLFDTETRTTVDQTLMFSIFRICKLVEGKYLCDREGVVYDGRLSDKELNTIGT